MSRWRIFFSRSRPWPSGRWMSDTTTSTGWSVKWSSPPCTLPASVTEKPPPSSMRLTSLRTLSSSSTTSTCPSDLSTLPVSCRGASTAATARSNSAGENGLEINLALAKAVFRSSNASAGYPDINTTRMPGIMRVSCTASSGPETPGMTTSESSTSMGRSVAMAISRASCALEASSTVKPSRLRMREATARTCASSSTSRMVRPRPSTLTSPGC